MNGYPTDRLVSGVIVGGLVTACIILLMLYLNIPQEQYFSAIGQLAMATVVAACSLFVRPLLLKTVLSARRDPLLLDEDLNMTLLGRAMGILGGLLIGVTLAMELL